jgi:hypothetical protein
MDLAGFALTPQPPVRVHFQGERAREGPLTLGQLNILQWITGAPGAFDSTIGGPVQVPEGTRVADVVAGGGRCAARQ